MTGVHSPFPNIHKFMKFVSDHWGRDATAIPATGSGEDVRRDASPSTGSTSRSAPARCTASSARTAPASPPRSGCCSGCCAPTPGEVRLLGGDPWRDAVDAAPPAGLRARRGEPVAEPHRRRGHRPARPAARRPRPARAGPSCSSGSTSTRPRRRRAYSKGNRQKVALVAALASDVELLLLDEPTSGLDPLMEAVFQRRASARRRRRAARCCCPATSWPRWRRCATGSASSGPAAPCRTARSPSCAT